MLVRKVREISLAKVKIPKEKTEYLKWLSKLLSKHIENLGQVASILIRNDRVIIEAFEEVE